MRSDYEELKLSNHREAFERHLSEISRSANYFVAVSPSLDKEDHRQNAILLLLGSAFKAGLVEGKQGLSQNK